MTRTLLCRLALGLCFCFAFTGNVWSWDNELTHKDISRIAGEQSVLSNSNGDFLRNLNFGKELLEEFSLNGIRRTVRDWLQEGAKREDAGSSMDAFKGKARYNNHFHNPLKDWNASGLNDSITLSMPFPPYKITYYAMGESALKWAQDKANQRSYSEDKRLEGDQTWQTIRDDYYYALTSKTDLDRQSYFARTFKGLGHQIHLIQDMAVPAHVRNDAHPEDSMLEKRYYVTGDLLFETWAKKNSPIINSFAAKPTKPDVDLTKSAPGFAPISQFYDTDQYAESYVPSTSLGWGLAEYTNANFVSDDTIFTEQFNKDDQRYFPYPRYTGYAECYEQYEEPYRSTNKMRKYWRKKAGGCAGEAVEHFVQVEPWFKYAPTWDIQRWAIYLDEATHKDYAEKLVSRAVGYSAALLNYFFRGDIRLSYVTDPTPGYVIVNNTNEALDGTFSIYYDTGKEERFLVATGQNKASNGGAFDLVSPKDAKEPGKYIVVFKGKMGNETDAVAGYVFSRLLEITPPSQFIYAMVDGNQDAPEFTSIRVKIKNAKPAEAIQAGVIRMVAKYKTNIDDAKFTYSMSAPRSITSLPSNEATEMEFDFSGDPIAVDVTDLYLQVIFKGKVGDENDAVAIGTKDISEPTPVDIFNNMDRICINGSWYVTGSVEADNALPESAKWWDYWTHDLTDMYVKVSPANAPTDALPTNYTFFTSEIESGARYRMYMLSDYEFYYSGSGFMVGKEQADNFIHDGVVKKASVQGMGVRNQREYSNDSVFCSTYGNGRTPCTAVRTSTFNQFRGVEMWGGFVFDGVTYPNNTDPGYIPCSWNALRQ